MKALAYIIAIAVINICSVTFSYGQEITQGLPQEGITLTVNSRLRLVTKINKWYNYDLLWFKKSELSDEKIIKKRSLYYQINRVKVSDSGVYSLRIFDKSTKALLAETSTTVIVKDKNVQPIPSSTPSPSSTPKPTATPLPTATPRPQIEPSITPIQNSDLSPKSARISVKGFQLKYLESHPIAQLPSNIKRVIIVVHGVNGNYDDYYNNMVDAVKIASSKANSDSTLEQNITSSTAVVAPWFPTEEQKSQVELYWTSYQSGSNSRRSTNADQRDASSFEVGDALLEKLSLNSNLKEIILTGHSGGGQFTQKYALACRACDNLGGIKLRFITANPGHYAYLSEARPIDTKRVNQSFTVPASSRNCSGEYHDYPQGLNSLYNYLESKGKAQIISSYPSRDVTYMLGTADTVRDSNLSVTCASDLQGDNRYLRGMNYYEQMNIFFAGHNHKLVQVQGVGHSNSKMYQSPEGIKALFQRLK